MWVYSTQAPQDLQAFLRVMGRNAAIGVSLLWSLFEDRVCLPIETRSARLLWAGAPMTSRREKPPIYAFLVRLASMICGQIRRATPTAAGREMKAAADRAAAGAGPSTDVEGQ
jgi:hypothetical protein